MKKQRQVTVEQLQGAFDAIIPGFYDAWRKARNSRPGNTRKQRTEPNPRRIYANFPERLLTVYQAERQAAHSSAEKVRNQLGELSSKLARTRRAADLVGG